MASISRHIPPSHVLLDVEVADKWELIERMASVIVENPTRTGSNLTFEDVRSALFSRERERSTALGDGLAFPHARLADFSGLEICMASLRAPVDFDAPDGKPVRFVCLVLTPVTAPTVALKVQSWTVGIFLEPAFRDLLETVLEPQTVCDFLRERDQTLEAPVHARDIMRKPLVNVYVDTPLRKMTGLMMEHRLDAVAVLDRDGVVVGEITCDTLFHFGIPDFFRQLKSVSFIREFDAFEKYFAREADLTAGDLMETEFSVMSEDATLLEIVFAFSVQLHPKIHVVDASRHRVGVIDRIAVLDRVIHF